MATAKYSFGSWGTPCGAVSLGSTAYLYAGYEWIQQKNPSDPQNQFRDDGFQFNATNAAASLLSAERHDDRQQRLQRRVRTGTGCTDEISQVIWTGAKYGITRDLDLIGAYYHYIQNSVCGRLCPRYCVDKDLRHCGLEFAMRRLF